MRGFRAVDRGRVKRRRTRGRMRRGSLACVETLRGKYTLSNGSTSAQPETGSALRRAANRRARRRWKHVTDGRCRNGRRMGSQSSKRLHRHGTAKAASIARERQGTAQGAGLGASDGRKARVGPRRNGAPREKPAPRKPERTRNGRSRESGVKPSPRVGSEAARNGCKPNGRRRQ